MKEKRSEWNSNDDSGSRSFSLSNQFAHLFLHPSSPYLAGLNLGAHHEAAEHLLAALALQQTQTKMIPDAPEGESGFQSTTTPLAVQQESHNLWSTLRRICEFSEKTGLQKMRRYESNSSDCSFAISRMLISILYFCSHLSLQSSVWIAWILLKKLTSVLTFLNSRKKVSSSDRLGQIL